MDAFTVMALINMVCSGPVGSCSVVDTPTGYSMNICRPGNIQHGAQEMPSLEKPDLIYRTINSHGEELTVYLSSCSNT